MDEKDGKDRDLEKELEALYRKVASTDPREESCPPEHPTGTAAPEESWLSEEPEDSPLPAKSSPKYRLLIMATGVLSFLCLLGVSAVFFWPTFYYYEFLSLGGKAYPVRINKLTGDTRYFNGTAWLSPPVVEIIEKPVSGNLNNPSTLKSADGNHLKDGTEVLKGETEKQNIVGKAKYVIQIKAFPENQEKDALAFMEELKKKIPDIQMKTSLVAGRGIWHRIWVGNFMTLKEASDSMKKLKLSDSYPGSFIRTQSAE